MEFLLVAPGLASAGAAVPAASSGGEGLVINGFWLLVALLNFALLFVVLQLFAFGPISKMLADRRERIEQGLRDAERARRDRDSAEQEHLAAVSEARREANEIIARAQKASADARELDIAATRDELARLRERAAAEIEAEKQKAIAELRGEVTDLALAAASRVVADSMTGDRQRKLVADFLAESSGGSRN
jgi:F-type H+-transporting ATPase subunit b